MNGGSRYWRILTGFLLCACVYCQNARQNCSLSQIYCPETSSCEPFSTRNCRSSVCSGDRFVCDEGSRCYSKDDRCDAATDCKDGTDEMLCGRHREPSFVKCFLSNRCQGIRTTTTSTWDPVCPEHSCDGGRTCYSASQHCDQFPQCGDYADERDCPCYNRNACADGRGCYSDVAHCDNYDDCPDRSDEENCPNKGVQVGPVIGAVVGVVAIAAVIICCKYVMQNTGRSNPPLGAAAYHSAANFREANQTFQSSHSYNNNNSSQHQRPQSRALSSPPGSANGYGGSTAGDPASPVAFSYPIAPPSDPSPRSHPSAAHGDTHLPPVAPESPPFAPPPAYDSLFPENAAK